MDFLNFGIVTSVCDGICKVVGLNTLYMGEMVEINNETRGVVLNLEEDYASIVIFGNDRNVMEGDTVTRLDSVLSLECTPSLLGCVVDGLGNIIDNRNSTDTLIDWTLHCTIIDLLNTVFIFNMLGLDIENSTNVEDTIIEFLENNNNESLSNIIEILANVITFSTYTLN